MKTKQLQQLFSKNLENIYSNTEINKLFEIFSKEYLNYSRIDILINKYNELDEKEISKFKLALEKLISGKPYQQILGKTYFYGNKFLVNENVLIPRPETEELVELTLNKIQKTDKKQLKILDIGTGSACIAITLAKYLKNAIIYAVDLSHEAIDISKKNAEIHNTEINFILMDYLFEDITKISDTGFDIIISNPPYISIQEESCIEKQVKGFEPKMALFAPKEDPLAFYRKIANDAQSCLNKEGFIFLEINQRFGYETLKLFTEKFPKSQLLKDLSGNDRFITVTS